MVAQTETVNEHGCCILGSEPMNGCGCPLETKNNRAGIGWGTFKYKCQIS